MSEMFRPKRGHCHKLAWFILKTALYGSRILGLFPFTFSSRTKQLTRSRWLLFYSLIINLLVLLSLVYYNIKAPKQRKLDAFERNPLLEYLNIIIGVMSVFAGLVTHILNYWMSKKVLWILNEMMYLENKCFRGADAKNCPKFNCCVIQKGVLVVGEVLSLLIVQYGMPGYRNSLPAIILSCLIQVGLNLMVMHFHVGKLVIYRYLWLINGQLLDMINHLRGDSTADSSRIRFLISLYSRLLELNDKIGSTYQLQMSLLVTAGLGGNIVIIYFLIVYGISLRKLSLFLMIFPQSLFMNLWDFCVNIGVCDLTEQTGRKTSTILKLFADLEHYDVELERSVNEFACLCSHRKFRFRLCNLFSVNYKMGFQMIITTLLYLVYLVQFDFKNL
ncbi:hypothetical protein KR009_005336 [Drosophila setifemur]|nr:hypothetical protein KR009_005336 [Drosophila setifemur]